MKIRSTVLLVQLVCVIAACGGSTTSELPTTITADDSGWPRQFAADGTTVTVYQPQIESWRHYSSIIFRAAVSFTPDGAEEPAFGGLRLHADTDTDLDGRRVLFGRIEILDSNYPTLDDETAAVWTERISTILPREPMPVDLDRILAYFEHTDAEIVTGSEEPAPSSRRNELNHDAPVIFVSQEPAVLVILDGEAVLSPIDQTSLLFAVNTNWNLFFDSKAARYYLLNLPELPADAPEDALPSGGSWLTATFVEGPWTPADELPPDFLRLGDGWRDVNANLPAERPGPDPVPVIFASTRPAELVVIDGAPALTPITGTRLMWVRNTDSDLFLYGGDGSYYYLVSGRWFRTTTLDGPWQFATPDLPEEFAAIPADHERAGVLYSVPGTAQASEAANLALVPTKATVKRSEATAEVSYQGEPEFKPIEGTSMAYAANTSSDVIRVGDLYYLCFQGVWFVSTSANGPWEVTGEVAQEIYTIPASSPVNHVTHVTVYDSGPNWVTVGYTAAYIGLMVAIFDDHPVCVYGTGWYHPPYVYHHHHHPVYYPHHHSYGAAAWYNPHTGTYGRGASVYGPYGGAGRAAAYNPHTGTYARGAAAWGPYGGSAAYQAYNPRTDTYRAGYRSASPYASWGEGVVERGDKWAHGGYYSDSRGTVAGVHTSDGDRAAAVHRKGGGTVVAGNNNVFVGKDGEVYRRGGSGWSSYDNGKWSAPDKAEGSNRAAVSESQREEARSRASQTKEAGGLSDSQREQARSPAAPAGSGSGAGLPATSPSSAGAAASSGRSGWESPKNQQDTQRQLNRDAKARSEGSRRARESRSRSSGSSTSRSRPGRSRSGGRGR